MKNWTIGCFAVLGGFFIGVLLTLGFWGFSNRVVNATPDPGLPLAPSDVTITASTAFLNAQFQQAARQSNILKQSSITLQAPNIIKTMTVVDVTLLGQRITANATITMRVTVRNNRILLAVEKIETGNLPVPQSSANTAIENLRAQAENQINALVQRGLQGTGLRVQNVRMNANEMIVDLTAQ
jgi:hypothetical protein